ncbi:MAG: adenylate kinase [Dehalococcoidales bacterium]|nr:adenylate kinase [Dehalococcoidales bacterium]
MYVILLGAPGAGKGTQVTNIAVNLNLVQMSTGDLFRQAAAEGTELGKQAQGYMKEGKLVPDEITIKMVMEKMAVVDNKSGVVFDGFPRTLKQAEALDKALVETNKKIDKVVYIKVNEEELLKRLSGRWICRKCQTPYHSVSSPPKVAGKCDKCGGELYQRTDDQAETVKNRLKVYFAETAPLIEYYRKAGKLLEINGEGDIEEISRRLIASLRGN